MDDDIKAVGAARDDLRKHAMVLVTVCGFLWFWLKTPDMDAGGGMKIPVLDITTKDFNAGHVILIGPLLIFLWYLYNISACTHINEVRRALIANLIERRRNGGTAMSARERHALLDVASPASNSWRRAVEWAVICFQCLILFWAPVITYAVIYSEMFSLMEWEREIDATHCVNPWSDLSVAFRDRQPGYEDRIRRSTSLDQGCRVLNGDIRDALYTAPHRWNWFWNDGREFRACRPAGPYEQNARSSCLSPPHRDGAMSTAPTEARTPIYDRFPYVYPRLQAWGYLLLGIAMLLVGWYATTTYTGIAAWRQYFTAVGKLPSIGQAGPDIDA